LNIKLSENVKNSSKFHPKFGVFENLNKILDNYAEFLKKQGKIARSPMDLMISA
jgi:hypothetical protein